jgi:hypothetical protein
MPNDNRGVVVEELVYLALRRPGPTGTIGATGPLGPTGPIGPAATKTFKKVNNTTGAYAALATDDLIEADLSGGALTGPVNIGTNAALLHKIVVTDYAWLVNGANLMIPVTGGAIPIQDPNTGVIAVGTVEIKQQGAQVAWTFDGTSMVLS